VLPSLRRRLATALDAADHEAVRSLLYTLIDVGAADEAVLVVLPWLPDANDSYPGIATFWLLQAAGPAAAAAAPALRELLTGPNAAIAMRAADTLWAITGEADELLPVYERVRTDVGDSSFCASLRELGPAAAPLAGRVREILDRPEPDFPVAAALWRITGEVDTTLPVLVRAWTADRRAHLLIAECWAEMGRRASTVEPLLRAELAEPSRATYDGSSETIPDDEEFLRAVGRALAALSG
jgi:hypothetical protein